MFSSIRNIWRSRLFRLSLSVLLLTMSVLTFADFFKLRGDVDAGTREARKSVAEAVAVQLTVLVGSADDRAIQQTVQAFVSRNTDVAAISLNTVEGTELTSYGDMKRLSGPAESTLARMTVPIFQNELKWGEVRVAFIETPTWPRQLAYFGFVAAGCFLLYLLFLRKALNQLDPSRVVPGRVNHAFNLLSEGVLILDTKLQIMLANDAMAELVGKAPGDLVGQNIDDWSWDQPDDWQAPWDIALAGGSHVADEPITLQGANGERRLMVNCAAVGAEENDTRGLLVTFDDMTTIEAKNRELESALKLLKRSQVSIQKKNEELEALATQDPLTGVANRRALLQRLANDFAKAAREDRPLSVVMTDIDFFKKINDTFGHVVGDDVIRVVANTLKDHCRDYDMVGRYGGEEFLVVLPDLDAQQALEVAERMRISISEAAEGEGLPLQSLTASLGVASIASEPETYMDLIDHADQALYAAKQGGRNRALVFNKEVVSLNPGESAA